MGSKKKERSKMRKSNKKMIEEHRRRVKEALAASSQCLLEGMEGLCVMGLNRASRTTVSPLPQSEDASSIELVYHSKSTLPLEWKEPLWDIFRRNMEEQYAANWGWREGEKKAEIFSNESRYLVAIQDQKPVGFIHLRYVLDEDEEPCQSVLYIYEIQLTLGVQRRGLGGRMMEIVEGIAMKLKIGKMKLTVFKSNITALNFYLEKLGYIIDPSSPSKWKVEECYEVLSKDLCTAGAGGGIGQQQQQQKEIIGVGK